MSEAHSSPINKSKLISLLYKIRAVIALLARKQWPSERRRKEQIHAGDWHIRKSIRIKETQWRMLIKSLP